MTDNWDRTLFDKDLKAILERKLPVSASKIANLQNLATTHPRHHNYIIQCITRFIETAPPDYRLAGLYVIDAITRHVHKQQKKREENNQGPTEADGYLKRFAIVLKDDSLNGCFEPCTEKDRGKVKKTLDIWEQSEFYPKEMVEYVKKSFLDSKSLVKENQDGKEKGTTASPVDTAMLLATLSNIGNGTLANLNIPGLTPTPPPSSSAQAPAAAAAVNAQESSSADLPPALAKLLGGFVSTPSPPPATNSVPSPPSDPRMRANDPRQRNWPIPQGPSIPQSSTTRAPGERKSRWGNANDTPVNNNANYNQAPPQQQQQQQNDPWLQRQAIQNPRMAMNNNNYSQAVPPPPTRSNQPYPHVPPPQQAYQPYQQQQPQPYQQYPQQQPMYNQGSVPQHQQQQHRERGEDPVSDPSLPSGCIKVLTRTLFVGPIPDHYEKEDITQIFSKYGELASVIVSKKYKGKHNAFLKFITRAATEAAKYESAGLAVEGVPVKVNWAFGFGPKKHFNYDRGDSIIPLAELSMDEKDNLMNAPVGGFQGQPVREQMTVEEPEAQYRPEWKNDDHHPQQQRGGQKRQGPSGANFEEINTNRKRSRFVGNGNNMNDDNMAYGMTAPPRQKQSRFDDSPLGNDMMMNYNGGQQQQMHLHQDFYLQQQQMQQQPQQYQYDPSSIPVNQYGDHQQ